MFQECEEGNGWGTTILSRKPLFTSRSFLAINEIPFDNNASLWQKLWSFISGTVMSSEFVNASICPIIS